jgi:4-aminobutyrate aminotransferase-like enzyme
VPRVTIQDAERIAESAFGLSVRAQPLGRQQAICDRMLELGVIIQPTSDRMCVLKIKPPLCLDVAGADFFADALDRVLTEGW